MTGLQVVYFTMKTDRRLSLWTPILIAVLLVSACAPAASTQPPATATHTPPSDTSTPAEGAGVPPATLTPDASPTPTIQFIPTSRGPDLEATDPATVSLASGGLQLVEFFRFT